MKLEFTTEIAVITLALHKGAEAIFSTHDLADMGEAVETALAPYAHKVEALAEAQKAERLEALKQGALNPRKSTTARNSDARAYYDATGEVLDIPDQPRITERLRERVGMETGGAGNPDRPPRPQRSHMRPSIPLPHPIGAEGPSASDSPTGES